jgi:hypothetical protein
MCTALIQCIWLQYNDKHLPYDNPKLPYGAYVSSLMPDDSHMVDTVHRDSTWCHMAPTQLGYGLSGCLRAPSTSYVAPWFPYGEHGSSMAHIWFSRCTFGSHLPYGSHTVHCTAPIQCIWLLYNGIHLPYDNPKLSRGAYGPSLMPDDCDSHMVHTGHRDSTWCHGSLTAPIWIIQLHQGTIHNA